MTSAPERRVCARRATAAALAALAFGVATAQAAPTGLNVIPTADVVPFRQWTLQLQNGNTSVRDDPTVFTQPLPMLQTQCGLFPGRVEAGLDAVSVDSPSDVRAVANLKVVALEEGYEVPAIALGASQLVRGEAPTWYVVASRTLNYSSMQYRKFRAHHRNVRLRGVRAHAGAVRVAGRLRALAGTDVEISERFVLYADWIAGRDMDTTLGGALVLDTRTSVQAAVLAGNGPFRVQGLQLALTRQFAW